ncbi:MAG: FKBP-type peptidyl-prolyl cis-trans isomerase [Paludibacteraceae bacterium]
MNLSFHKNIIFATFLVLFSYLLVGCHKEDHWIDWKTINEQWYETHKNDDGFTLLPSGTSYRVLRWGNPSDGKPNTSSYITATYTGKFFNDSIFDQDTTATLGLVSGLVSGFQEVILKMHPGDVYEFYLPWSLGYGSSSYGTIPPYSSLKFKVELIRFNNYN